MWDVGWQRQTGLVEFEFTRHEIAEIVARKHEAVGKLTVVSFLD